jgi:hypothetical protein
MSGWLSKDCKATHGGEEMTSSDERGDDLAPTTDVGGGLAPVGSGFWSGDGVAQSSIKDDWCTPKEFIHLVESFDEIGLDPCSSSHSLVNAFVKFDGIETDGLTENWTGLGLVYCNPPYGRRLIDWIGKIDDESHMGAEVIALLPARTDTAWFHLAARGCSAMVFLQGRLTFLGAPSSAPFPSVVVYWGSRVRRFCEAFSGQGLAVRL